MSKQIISPVICPACRQTGDLFLVNCRYCGNVLRDRVPNIDLGEIVLRIIDSPSAAFAAIIFSEKKNYVIPLVILLSIKNSIMYQAVDAVLFGREYFKFGEIQFVFLSLTASIISASSIFGLIMKITKKRLQIKQIGAAILYAQIPVIFAFAALFIPEFVIFGKYIFYKNPTIFLIHPFFAYFFLVIESGFYMWAFALTILACAHFFNRKVLIIIAAVFFFVMIHFVPFLIHTK